MFFVHGAHCAVAASCCVATSLTFRAPSPPLPPHPHPHPPTSRRNIDGRLRILADPDSYVVRLNQEAAALAERARRAAAEAEAAELSECTFTPAVHSAPEYVSRIAQSMALARSVKPQPAPARPDWR